MAGMFIRLGGLLLVSLMVTGCMTRMAPPQSPQSSLAIIEPIISGKMRVGLSWNSYSYHEKPSRIMLMNNQNRLACAKIKNTQTGAIFKPGGFAGASQCYYPNIPAGKYVLMDYPMVQPHETYGIFFYRLYNTLLFGDKPLGFSIGSGEVKHAGKYVVYMKDEGSKLEVQKIEKLDSAPSVAQARLELGYSKAPWKLK